MFSLLDMAINEICLHSLLWESPPQHSSLTLSLPRLKMLHRTMEGATSYLSTIVQSQQSKLYQLGIGSWAGWFYAVIVVCKLVFLRDNERLGRTHLDDIPEEIENLLPQDQAPLVVETERTECIDEPGWGASAVARDYHILQLLDQLMEKLRCTLPADNVPW